MTHVIYSYVTRLDAYSEFEILMGSWTVDQSNIQCESGLSASDAGSGSNLWFYETQFVFSFVLLSFRCCEQRQKDP